MIDESFYHVYTGIRSLSNPVKVEIVLETIQTFKDFQKDQQNDVNSKINKETKNFVLIPKYRKDLASDEILVPKRLHPLFSDDQSTMLKTYEWKILTELEEVKDIEDISYYLECRFCLSSLETLISTEGECKSIMTITIVSFRNSSSDFKILITGIRQRLDLCVCYNF